jgi:hypothetical protein
MKREHGVAFCRDVALFGTGVGATGLSSLIGPHKGKAQGLKAQSPFEIRAVTPPK